MNAIANGNAAILLALAAIAIPLAWSAVTCVLALVRRVRRGR